MLRGQLLVILLWRALDGVLHLLPALGMAGLLTRVTLWPHVSEVIPPGLLVAQVLGDLLLTGILLLLAERAWALPVSYVWLATSTLAVEGGSILTSCGLRAALPYLVAFLLLCWLMLWAFGKAGIRGRILLVCLTASVIPLVFLGIAFVDQAQVIDRHALLPVAQETLFAEAVRLNNGLSRTLVNDLAALLDTASTSPSLAVASVAVYRERAQKLGLPLLSATEIDARDARVAQAVAIFTEHPKTSAYYEIHRYTEGLGDHLRLVLPARAGVLVDLDLDLTAWRHARVAALGEGEVPGVVVIVSPDSATLNAGFAGFLPGATGMPGLALVGGATASGAPLFVERNTGYYTRKGSIAPGSPLAALGEGPELPRTSSSHTSGGHYLVGPRGEWLFQVWELDRAHAAVALAVPAWTVRWILITRQLRSIVLAILALLLAALMSVHYSEQLSRPLLEITEAARHIRDGDLTVRLPEVEAGNDEVSQLSQTLAVMAERLKGRIESANREVLAAKTRFETLVSSTWEGIFLVAGDGRVIYANPAAQQLLPTLASCGVGFIAVLTEVGADFLPPLPADLAAAASEWKTVFRLPGKSDGPPRMLTMYVKSLHLDESGAAAAVAGAAVVGVPAGPKAGFIAVCRDVTMEKEIDRMKSEFVSQVSHELRTPLTSIQAYTEMLLDDDTDDAKMRREYLEIIYEESQRLTRLINDLLDLARIESGRRMLQLVRLDLATVARDVVTIMAGAAGARKISVSLQVPDASVDLTCSADADLIKQVGLNLLSNAIKYTAPGGSITVRVGRTGDGTLAWSTADTGIGLTAQERERLFTKFFRADSDFVKAAGGTGLGLALVKQIVERHGGRIEVESTFAKGSTFTVLLPAVGR